MLRLLLDAHVDVLVASRLRERTHDVVAAREVGLRTAPDPDVLAFAAQEGRVLLTFNVRDFVPLHTLWLEAGKMHSGILVSRAYTRAEIGELLRLLENLFALATEDDFVGQLRFLTEFDE